MLVVVVRRRHGAIRTVRLDNMPARGVLLVDGAKDQLQMLAFALEVAERQDAHGQLEDVQLHDTSARVAQGASGRRVHRQRRHFGDRVPAG